MKIAVCYEKETKDVYQHFGDTEYFLIFDNDNNSEQVVDNGGYLHRDLIPYLSSLGVNVIIAGGMGSHAIDLFAMAGIKTIPGASGDAHEAVKAYLDGKLVPNMNAVHKCTH